MSPSTDEAPQPTRGRVRTAASWLTTALAVALVWFALVGPNRLDQLAFGAFVRIPIEALVVVTLGLLLPPRWRRVLAVVVGVLLGVVAVLKILDMGFFDALDRPFDPVTDWSYFGPAVGVLRDSVGSHWAMTLVVATVTLLVALLVFVPLSVVRLSRLTARHRVGSARTVAVLGVVWIVSAAFGFHIDPGEPVASSSAAALAYDQVDEVRTAIHDQQTFSAQLKANDPYSHVPSTNLLSRLRGKDVVVAFVESYGQVAVQNSSIAAQDDAALRAGTQQLHDAGFGARSGWLTSPTFGGISWLAHSTLQSGLWIDNQLRYNQLVSSDRLTLSDAFHRAGWRTVGDVPSNGPEWPQGLSFYHYDKLYNAENVGYAGPSFSYATMPDQYILSAFGRDELDKPHRRPVMAEIDLVSSHTPWAPLPHMVAWNKVGDGTIFNGMPEQGHSPDSVWHSAASVRAAYGQSVRYSMRALTSWVQTVHDKNLVLVVLGDHQPAAVVSGSGATHNVPISIIAHDPAVLGRISSWGWQDGLLPDSQAPLWPMDAFRNRFFAAYDGPPTAR
jgi:hypothetical protein